MASVDHLCRIPTTHGCMVRPSRNRNQEYMWNLWDSCLPMSETLEPMGVGSGHSVGVTSTGLLLHCENPRGCCHDIYIWLEGKSGRACMVTPENSVGDVGNCDFVKVLVRTVFSCASHTKRFLISLVRNDLLLNWLFFKNYFYSNICAWKDVFIIIPARKE